MNLNAKIGEMEFDGLVTGLNPPVVVGGGEIAALAAEEPSEDGASEGEALTERMLKRGTLLKKEDGVLNVYDGDGEPDCILCDDTEVGTDENVNVTVYLAGCFNLGKVETVTGCTLSEEDKDVLRTKNIYFKAPHEAN